MANPRKRWGWGLIGPGRFAREFAGELAKVDRARLVAVASRSPERAARFAKEFGFETSYGDYEALMSDPRVEIVYLVVPHVFHRELAEMAIRSGKAVVCEKPLTPDAMTTRSLTALARKRGVFLMEAMKTGFLPAIQRVRQWIAEGAIGEVRLARADFCFPGSTDPEDRLMSPALAGGCVLDVGIYPIHLCRFLLGEIESIRAEGHLAGTGVEDSVVMTSQHAGGAIATMMCSFRTPEQLGAVILGTEGRIEIPRFHAALRADLHRVDGERETFVDDSGGMVAAEIEAAMDALEAGLTECPGHTHADSIRLADLMDEALRQVR